MKFQPQRALSIAILCLGSACATTSPDGPSHLAETRGPGVAVEEVGQGSTLEKAGLRPGDLLFAWERPPGPPANPEGGEGEIKTVFDWLWVQTEQAPRGAVRLHGEREGTEISFEVPRGVWDARVRPRMAADLLQMYTEGRRRINAGDLEGGIALWNQLVQSVASEAVPGLRPWILLQVSDTWSKNRQGDKARSALQAVLEEAPDAQTRVALGEKLGTSYQLANEMARAEASFRSALEVGEAAWGESLRVASTISKLGHVLRLQYRLDEAEQLHGRALEIRQRLAPESLEVTDSLHQLCLVACNRSDTEAMSEHTRRALAIQEHWPPDTLAMADTLNDLGLLAAGQTRYGEAAAALQRALTILEQRSPETIPTAITLARLGWVAMLLRDDESAEELLQQALAIREKLAPESPATSDILSHLGGIAMNRGDLATAENLIRRALAITEKTAPEGLGAATRLDDLGVVARLQGNLDEAWEHHHRALEFHKRLSDRSYEAYGLTLLGEVAEARGDLNVALDLYQQAQAIYERLGTGTREEAWAFQQLGRLYRRTHRPDQAAKFLR